MDRPIDRVVADRAVPAGGHGLDVAAAAERAAGAGEHDAPHGRIELGRGERVGEGGGHRPGHRVARLGSVHRERQHALVHGREQLARPGLDLCRHGRSVWRTPRHPDEARAVGGRGHPRPPLLVRRGRTLRRDVPPPQRVPRREPAAGFRGCDGVAQRRAGDASRAARSGRAGVLRHLHLHQLDPRAPVRPRLGGRLRRPGAGGRRCADAGVRVRGRPRQRHGGRSRRWTCDTRSSSTTTTPSGRRSPTTTGRPSTSPTPRARSGTTTSARAATRSPRWSSACSSRTPAATSICRRVRVEPHGVEAAADWSNVGSPETYLGYERAVGFASPGRVAADAVQRYSAPDASAPQRVGAGG